MLPWLVTEGDLRRYLGRAINECLGGRVLLFFHYDRVRSRRSMLALAPYSELEASLEKACALMAAGRIEMVRLKDQPRID